MASNTLETAGVLYRKMDTQQVTDKLTKREFVIETTEEQYPQLIKFELMNEKTALIDGFKEGDKIKVAFNLRGREWKKNQDEVVFFTTLQAWKLSYPDGYTATAQQQPPTQPTNTPSPDDDLPF
jgi:translation initiation factor IF-3